MSKPISFGFGKSKAPASGPKQTAPFPARNSAPIPARSGTTLHGDSDNEDEAEPKHESVTGFSSSGAILSQPVQEKSALVIKNPGNSDWRRRGPRSTNLLPEEVRAAQNGDVVTVERDEVSKESGLQFADSSRADGATAKGDGLTEGQGMEPASPPKKLTEDERALQALLDGEAGRPKSNAVIDQLGNDRFAARDETEDFRSDVASRPDSSTLEDYAAMPVEEFGMAMLRGMGLKRRANGEVIDLNGDKVEDDPKKSRKQEGFLGIGAKAAPGSDIELGAWGKAEMRKNNKGEGFFTPLMRENKITGERITEEELQKRVNEAKGRKQEGDWRERRDRNLERHGRTKERDNSKPNGEQKTLTNGEDYRNQMNDFSRQNSSKQERDDRGYDSSRSRRDRRDGDHRDDDSSRSRRRERSRSRDGRRRHDDDKDDDNDHDTQQRREKHRDRDRDRDRDRHRRDDERYDSSSSKRSNHRDRDRDRERDDGHRHRDRR